MHRKISEILSMLSGFFGAVFAVEYALPATSIAEFTNAHVPLWGRILDVTMCWGLSIGAIYRSLRLLRINNVGPKSE
jgi:hypothetical protein